MFRNNHHIRQNSENPHNCVKKVIPGFPGKGWDPVAQEEFLVCSRKIEGFQC